MPTPKTPSRSRSSGSSRSRSAASELQNSDSTREAGSEANGAPIHSRANVLAGEYLPSTLAGQPNLNSSQPDGEQDISRRRMIEEAAYYRAERRGFEPGYELEDWLAAESELTQHSLERSRGGTA